MAMLAVNRPSKDTTGVEMVRAIEVWRGIVRGAAWTRCWLLPVPVGRGCGMGEMTFSSPGRDGFMCWCMIGLP